MMANAKESSNEETDPVGNMMSPMSKRKRASSVDESQRIKLQRYHSGRTVMHHDYQESHEIRLENGTKSQVKIMWAGKPRNCFMVKKLNSDTCLKQMQHMLRYLNDKNVRVYVEASAQHEFPNNPVYDSNKDKEPPKVDFCIALGGDGTLLHLNSHFQKNPQVPPTIAYAAGTLGFLTPFKFEHFERHLEFILRGSVPLYCSLRMRLECWIERVNGDKYPQDHPFQVLNEVLIDRGQAAALTTLQLTVDGYPTTRIQADGVIISTPTGSTAYSMSAGGAMVAPTVSAILLTPICPHSLSFRPLILPDSSLIQLSIPMGAQKTAWASFDGREMTQIFPGDQVVIKFSEWPVPSLNMSSYNTEWLHSIKNKLNWNQRNRDLPSPVPSQPTPSDVIDDAGVPIPHFSLDEHNRQITLSPSTTVLGSKGGAGQQGPETRECPPLASVPLNNARL